MVKRPSLSTVSVSRRLTNHHEADEFDVQVESAPTPIARIERYSINERIGQGGMGLVYHAHDKLFDREVAIKVLLPRQQAREQSRERFFQEARTTARLQHPGIVAVYDMGISEDQQPYFAMKFVR